MILTFVKYQSLLAAYLITLVQGQRRYSFAIFRLLGSELVYIKKQLKVSLVELLSQRSDVNDEVREPVEFHFVLEIHSQLNHLVVLVNRLVVLRVVNCRPAVARLLGYMVRRERHQRVYQRQKLDDSFDHKEVLLIFSHIGIRYYPFLYGLDIDLLDDILEEIYSQQVGLVDV